MLAHKLNSNERKTQGGAVDEHFRGIINVCKGSVNYSEKISSTYDKSNNKFIKHLLKDKEQWMNISSE